MRHYLSVLAAPLLGITLLFSACSDGGGTTEPTVTPPVQTRSLRADSTATPPYGLTRLHITGATMPSGSITGTLGGATFTGYSVDDSTIAMIVPVVNPGTYEARLTINQQVFAGNVAVASAATAVTNPDTYLEAFLKQLEAGLSAREAGLPGIAVYVDTVGMRREIAQSRQLINELRTELTKTSAGDKATMAAFVSTNYARLGLTPNVAPSLSLVAGPCDWKGFSLTGCYDQATANLNNTTVRLLSCAIWVTTSAGVGAATSAGLAGLISGGSAVALGVKLGAAIGGVVGLALCLPDAIGYVVNTLALPAYTELMASFQNPAGSIAVADVASHSMAPADTFVIGVARPVTAQATVRSLMASDVNAPGALGAIAQSFLKVQQQWRDLTSKYSFGASAPPSLPVTPKRTEVLPVPADYLRVGTISPAGTSATANTTGAQWNVTLQNSALGRTQPLSLQVRLLRDGMGDDTNTFAATVRPQVSSVATVTITDTATLAKGNTKTFVPVVRDSNSVVLTGRTISWTSSNVAVARVDAATGLITAVDTGLTSIVVKAKGTRQDSAQATLKLRVTADALYGTYSLVSADGKPLPLIIDPEPNVYKFVGGSYTLNPNGTASFLMDARASCTAPTPPLCNVGFGFTATFTRVNNTITLTTSQPVDSDLAPFLTAQLVNGSLAVTWQGHALVYTK